MNRTRIMFFSLIGVAVLVVGVAAFLQTSGVLGRQATQTAATQAQVAPQVAVTLVPSATAAQAAQAAQATTAPATEATAGPTQAPAQAATSANSELLKPVWGPNYKEGDGLGRLVCGAYAFSGDYPLQQIQMAGSGYEAWFSPRYCAVLSERELCGDGQRARGCHARWQDRLFAHHVRPVRARRSWHHHRLHQRERRCRPIVGPRFDDPERFEGQAHRCGSQRPKRVLCA